MVTISKVDEKLKENGKKSWRFTLSDGKAGYITNDKPWEYKEGESVTYTCENKGTYNLLTLTRVSTETAQSPNKETKESFSKTTSAQATVPQSVDIRLLKVDCAKTAMDFVMENYRAEKIKAEEVATKFKEAANLLYDEIDDIFAGK